MEKILLYIVSGDTRASWERAVELGDKLSAALYALFVVDKETVRRVSELRGSDEIDTAVEIEEQGWKYLYHLEEKAIENGVRTAIFLEEGNSIDIIRNFVKEKNIDLLIVGYKREEGRGGRKHSRMVEQLVEYVHCPVLIEKEEER